MWAMRERLAAAASQATRDANARPGPRRPDIDEAAADAAPPADPRPSLDAQPPPDVEVDARAEDGVEVRDSGEPPADGGAPSQEGPVTIPPPDAAGRPGGAEAGEAGEAAAPPTGSPPEGPADTTPGPPGGPAGGARGTGPRHRWRRLPRSVKGTITVVALFFVLEYLLLPEIANARRSVRLLGQVDILWLFLALGLEICALAAYAELTHTVLSPGAPSRFRLLRINMSSLAVSHVLPGGTAPGAAVAYRLLGESGVRGSTAAFGLATQGVGSAVVLNIIFWFFLLISIPLRGYNPLYGFAAIAGVILLAAFGGIVLMLTKGRGQEADRLYRIAGHVPFVNPEHLSALVQRIADRLKLLIRNRQLVTHAMIWAAANWLLDAASLWIFVLAFGHLVSPIDLLVAYGLANILAVITLTPSGLGVVEGVLIPTLAGFGVPKDVAVLGVLSWRLVNFWLPIPVGGASYLSLRLGPFARTGRTSGRDGHPAKGHAPG